MGVHIEVDGAYAVCEDEACALLIHLPLDTVEEVQALPYPVLLALIEAFDPPAALWDNGGKMWQNSVGRMHRDYDLPAVTWPNGSMYWAQHGSFHRESDKPAMVAMDPDGTRWLYWYREGIEYQPD